MGFKDRTYLCFSGLLLLSVIAISAVSAYLYALSNKTKKSQNFWKLHDVQTQPEDKRIKIVWCTISRQEQHKCLNLGRANERDRIRVGYDYFKIECKQAFNKDECMKMLDRQEATLTTVDAAEVFSGGRYYSLVPIAQEVLDGGFRHYYAVAVVKKNTLPEVQSLYDLRNKKACFAGVETFAGWLLPIYTLMRQGGMDIIDCNNHVKSATKFFGPSCAVNCLTDRYNPIGDNSDKLCQLCIGKIPGGRCTDDDPYAGFEGAFRCLIESGEVAFLRHTTVPELMTADDFTGISKDSFELLCKDGSRRPIEDHLSCNWGQVPTNTIMTSSATTFELRKTYQLFLERIAKVYGRHLINSTRTDPNPDRDRDFYGERQPEFDQFGNHLNRFKRQNFGNFGTQDRSQYGDSNRQDPNNPYRSNDQFGQNPDSNNPYNQNPDPNNPYRSNDQYGQNFDANNPHGQDTRFNSTTEQYGRDNPYGQNNDQFGRGNQFSSTTDQYGRDNSHDNNDQFGPNNQPGQNGRDNPYGQNNDQYGQNGRVNPYGSNNEPYGQNGRDNPYGNGQYDANGNPITEQNGRGNQFGGDSNDPRNRQPQDPFARDPYTINREKFGENIDPYVDGSYNRNRNRTPIQAFNNNNITVQPPDDNGFNQTNVTFFEVFSLFESSPRYGYHGNLIFQDAARAIAPLSESQQTFSSFLGDSLNIIMGVRDCQVNRMTLCVTSDMEKDKCVKMRTALKAQLLKPEMECYKGHSQIHCMQAIRSGTADVAVLDASDVYTAGLHYELVPFISEVYNLNDPEYYVVAVGKESDPSTELTYLRGKYTCHGGINTAAGWVYPLAFLISNGWIRPYGCNSIRAAAEYFTKSCVPGALSTEYNTGVPYDNMCDLCHGASYRYCRRDASEDYYGHTGAFRCLVEGGGHVAFVKHTTVTENTGGKREEWWARDNLNDDYELLCPDGTRAEINEYTKCNLGKVKANAIVTRGGYDYNATHINAYINLFLYAQTFYGRKTSDEFSFSMFSSPPPYTDLIFQDATTQLRIIEPSQRLYSNYLGSDFMRARRIVDCHAGSARISASLILTISSVFALVLRY